MPLPVPQRPNNGIGADDIFFTPVSDADPSLFFQSANHPLSLPHGIYNDFFKKDRCSSPIETNSFYGNLLVDNQTAPVWTHPYSMWYTANREDEQQFFGWAISHVTSDQRVFGPNPNDDRIQYYFNPAGIKSFVFTAQEFNDKRNVVLEIDSCEKFSTNIYLSPKNSNSFLKFPLVQGMGFITGIYFDLIPKLQSGIGIQNFELDHTFKSANNGMIQKKYKIKLFNNIIWTLYVTSTEDFKLELQDPQNIVSANIVRKCIIQLASGSNEAYDKAAGCYPTACKLSAKIENHGSKASYAFNYTIEGKDNSFANTTLMYALPHHQQSFASSMNSRRTDLQLDSTVCGKMSGYLTNEFLMEENLPAKINMDPWIDYANFHGNNYTPQALESIKRAISTEFNDDVVNISNTDSMYSSGKILDKYAYILYVIAYVLKDKELALRFADKLETAINRFTTNQQQCPLVFDQTWKGIVSSAGLDGNIFKDFGNTHYNDHHFHYGYHIHSCAILAKFDKEFKNGEFLRRNKEWVNFLIRDVANPRKDNFFPESRSFDWFNGHSWAKGMFPSFDGKDEESSSEDYNFAYALKIWGNVVGDKNIESRGNLMLAIMKRSMNNYMLYKDDNTVEPSKIIKNKVSGIMFENKIDHATYFGTNLEYIQGIHMLPITPISSYIRSPQFVKEEWEQLLKNHVLTLDDGWKGILMLNLALYDPHSAWNFFNDSRFQMKWLDNGMSLTWCLAFCAGVSQ
ncbi:hypothetical protein PACTADRAFT_38201 [Pachysolen tannophilus NRRL Y-2460]|uniref:glucan endo-1,3-beta-D-glucosidase n=1 Tax=Pachysolen tannophilus NRRL Y-2460 TaxID=669874 RepID=A0A1E4U1P7_PACTA|nr:hypothetical protein PACTADRAFT_38201 [Pachysolen tannophilus NRRL Y-2460]